MPGPFFRVELHLIPAEKGGRKHPLRDDYRPNWELGNTWLGEPMLHDGRVFLEDTTQLQPGRQGNARVEPLRPEYWGGVGAGRVLAVQEGARMVGHATVLEVVANDGQSDSVAARVEVIVRDGGLKVLGDSLGKTPTGCVGCSTGADVLALAGLGALFGLRRRRRV